MANYFIALTVPPGEWLARIPEPPSGVRCFSRDDLHITVAFLGAVDERRAYAAFALASGWPTRSLDIVLGDVIPMGSARSPSALSAVLHEGKEAVSYGIAAVRDAMCDAAGAARDARPPLPHITLARPSRKARPEQRREAVRWAQAIDLGRPRLCITQLALYTWAIDRHETLFRVVGAMRLEDIVCD